ncbi:phage portal protein, partial [Roseiarcus fermentans]
LDVIDGATIKPLIGDDGRAPEPPDPAYQQVLHGVPAADFSADELLYLPRNARTHRLYGLSPVEQVALTVNIALRREAATLDYYRTGSSPDAFATLPKEWTVDQIRSFQDYFDALMSGNSARRRMLKFMPSEFKLIETRQPPLKDQYDEWLARVICYAFSVPATPFVAQVNRATSETMRMQATQEGLLPLKSWIKNALDSVIQGFLGEPGLEFVWVGDDAVDPLQQAQTLQILVSAGIKMREEARAELGLGGDKAGAGLGKYNHNHDEAGRFSTAADAVNPGAAEPDGKPKPKGVQVASLDNIAPDASVDGGTANEAAVAATNPDAGAAATSRNKPASAQEYTIVNGVPSDATSYTTGDGTRFYAPPDADFRQVYAAGRANGRNINAARSAIGASWTYAFQRRDGTFYSAYTDASNYAVGVYMAGAGYSYTETVLGGTAYAMRHSSNWESGFRYHIEWWTKGWNGATIGSGPFSHR